jgi:thiamine kinase-like enzyme
LLSKHASPGLTNLERSASTLPEFAAFLNNTFKPLFNDIITASKKAYELSSHDFNKQLEDEFLILSPVDFGFHNALVKNQELVFLDFEYFGLDDSTHLIGDVVLHPGMNIAEDDKKYFAEISLELLSRKDPFNRARYHALMPLYALRWACIILNPFLDTYQIIGSNINSAEDLANLRKTQFAKAELYIKKAATLLEELKSFNQLKLDNKL